MLCINIKFRAMMLILKPLPPTINSSHAAADKMGQRSAVADHKDYQTPLPTLKPKHRPKTKTWEASHLIYYYYLMKTILDLKSLAWCPDILIYADIYNF